MVKVVSCPSETAAGARTWAMVSSSGGAAASTPEMTAPISPTSGVMSMRVDVLVALLTAVPFHGWLRQQVARAACFADRQLSGAREEVPAAAGVRSGQNEGTAAGGRAVRPARNTGNWLREADQGSGVAHPRVRSCRGTRPARSGLKNVVPGVRVDRHRGDAAQAPGLVVLFPMIRERLEVLITS